MWETINNAVGKLTAWDIRAIIAVIIIVYLWLCVKARSPWPFRRDKKGRIYCFSHSYEVAKQRTYEGQSVVKCLKGDVESLKTSIAARDEDTKAQLKRLETEMLGSQLQQAIYHTPEAAMVIEEMAKKYKEMGGNSYTERVVNTWRNKYEQSVVERRIDNKE